MKEKKCTSCNLVKPLEEFEKNQFSPDGHYLICKLCFEKRLKEPPTAPEPEKGNQEKSKSEMAVPAGQSEKKVREPTRHASPGRPVRKHIEPEAVVNEAESIRAAQQAVLSENKEESLDFREILPKLRKCNGCKKIEPVEKIPLVPPQPVHAWFCEKCINNKRFQYVGKGYLVYDYWGRIYKVTRVLNKDVIQGVVKKKNGKWSNRKFNIHGRWITKKPL